MHETEISEFFIHYDGSPDSVKKLMDALSRTKGIMNTEEGLYFDGMLYPKGSKFMITRSVSVRHIQS